jgi:hypothetical protein
MLAGWIVLLLIVALLPAWLAQRKGRSFGLWYVGGVLLWPLVLLEAIFMKDQSRRCPHCAESIRAEAHVCPHCQRDVEPEAATV